MKVSRLLFAGVALAVAAIAPSLTAQEKKLPPPDRAPHLVLAQNGPHAPVTALAFSPDASTLYVGGFDKQVRRYKLVKDKAGKERYEPDGSFRVPVGPGNAGVVNAVAVSPDGKWVAVAGRAPMRGENWTKSDDGTTWDARNLPELLKEDAGVVYLFDPANPNGGKVVRGQESGVRALAFANPAPAGGHALVTAGVEWDAKGNYAGAVRVFDAATGKELASRTDLPGSAIPPGLGAWSTGEKKDGLRVIVAWDDLDPNTGKPLPSKLLTWDDPDKKGAKEEWGQPALLISPLTVRTGKDGRATELLTGGYDPALRNGGLRVRPAAGGEIKTSAFKSADGRPLLPTAIAALTVAGVGEATAVLLPAGADAAGQRYELRLLAPSTDRRATLEGFSYARPMMTASPDGRFVAVAGFTDNRVEVYNAAAFAAGEPAVEKLSGAEGGFPKVAFLAGEKLWLGREGDSLKKGGVVLDLAAKVRVAAPRGEGELRVDGPAGAAAPKALDLKNLPKEIKLGADEVVTAAILLPGKPAWDPALGAVVVVAHVHKDSRSVRVTVFDAVSGKAIIKLGGPTLPVTSLAFSGTRPLLAAAGGDGTVAVWSLKNFAQSLPAIEGVLVTDRGGEVAVVTVAADSPALKKLEVGDVVESVADAKGVQRPVKESLDFVLAVRALKVGDNAQIKVKGKAAAVAVPVGTATGFRHPLFTLWVDPKANDGKHEWVGWTAAGPYDASGEAGEARIGWITATGDEARPVTFAAAKEYRKLFYKRDFLRLLVEKADFNEALAAIPPPRRATLTARLLGPTEERNGVRLAREKLDGVEITLSDPDSALELARAELRWQVSGPGGASEWRRLPFGGAQAVLDLKQHVWDRGEHRVHVKLFKSATAATPEDELTAAVQFVPPAPVLTVRVDGKPLKPGVEIVTENKAVAVTAAVDTKNPAGADVHVSWTAGGAPVKLARKPDGTFAAENVTLADDATTSILVTATNSGPGAKPEVESQAVEVRVRKLPPKAVAPPAIKVLVQTEHDFRTATDQPFVVSTRQAVVTATVQSADPLEAFEWKVGDKEWEAGKPDPKTGAETREIPLPEDGQGVAVQVRAKVKNSPFATDSARVIYDGLPDVSVALPQPQVTSPNLKLTGGLKVRGKRDFTVRVVVTSRRTNQTREIDPTPNPELTGWDATVPLFPGVNDLGYVVTYDGGRKQLRREKLIEVNYARPPAVATVTPIDVGTGSVGDLTLAVLSPSEAPPTQLLVNDARVDFPAPEKPLDLLPVWVVRATGVSVRQGEQRLKSVAVLVRNAEHEGRAVSVPVVAAEPKPVAPPRVTLLHDKSSILSKQQFGTNEGAFPFSLRVTSETRLSRVEVWQFGDRDPRGEEVGGLKPADAAGAPGNFELNAAPELRLRAGLNRVKVVAANAGQTVETEFTVTYTPPPVRVVIDSIREPGGEPIAVSQGPAQELHVNKGVVEVEGRVVWTFDDEPIATDPNLSVVFSANGVTHLPVRVPLAKEGKERKFSGRVYLNSLGNPNPVKPIPALVQIELRSGGRTIPIPQEQQSRQELTVVCDKPITRERYHVVMLGVEVPEGQRKELVRNVIRAVGGTIPADSPNFTEGRFNRPNTEFAYLYSPRLGYTKSGDLNALLNAVRTDIERRVRKPDDEWVNDVIVVYYHGDDWMEKDGRWLLHSATTLSGVAGDNAADYAIRLDDLPQVPGLPLAVLNVPRKEAIARTLSVGMAFVRCAGENAEARQRVLPQFAVAREDSWTLDDLVTRVRAKLGAATTIQDGLTLNAKARGIGEFKP